VVNNEQLGASGDSLLKGCQAPIHGEGDSCYFLGAIYLDTVLRCILYFVNL
jgi:hypothetical protein